MLAQSDQIGVPDVHPECILTGAAPFGRVDLTGKAEKGKTECHSQTSLNASDNGLMPVFIRNFRHIKPGQESGDQQAGDKTD